MPYTARFEGGSKAGQIETLQELMPRLRYPYLDHTRPIMRLPEDAPLPTVEYTAEEYEYWNRGRDGTFVYRWVNPEPALRRRIAALEGALRISQDELLELKFGPGYKDAAFEDGLGGW